MIRLTASAAARLQAAAEKGATDAGPKRKVRCTPNVARLRPYSAVTSICFDFPLPPTGCSPNNSGGSSHWRVKEGARAEYRAECLGYLPPINYHSWGRMFERANIEAQFFLGADPGRYHPRDEQNASASIKALVDALVDAGYIIDDSAKYLHWEGVELCRQTKLACVRITLSRTTK